MISLFKLFFPHFLQKTKTVSVPKCGGLDAALHHSASRMQTFLEENRFIFLHREISSEETASFAQTRVAEGEEEESNLQSNRVRMLN